ncbi:hypothetical protein VKT23_010057 [Stygiomarasmius scandens]|uniref:Mitochondrial carrier n=1 Tax=Marasmiellus scandens TaxID=2682957 RepID=A0ABR1JDJ6_9AGAR
MSTIPFTNFFAVFGFPGLFLTVLLNGALVRYRASFVLRDRNDNQKPEDASRVQVQAYAAGPSVNGVFHMLVRVGKLEGWAGFLKGLVPTCLLSMLLFNLFLHIFSALLYLPTHTVQELYFLQAYFPPATLLTFFLVSIPSSIIVNRAICTPYRLHFFRPKQALRVLLSEEERKRPWKLWGLGLVSAHAVHGVVKVTTLVILPEIVRKMLKDPNPFISRAIVFFMRSVVGSNFEEGEVDGLLTEMEGNLRIILEAFIWFGLAVIASLLLAPLEVMMVRLTTQKLELQGDLDMNGPSVKAFERTATEAEQAVALGLQTYSDEAVVQLRCDTDLKASPYTSLYDCFIRMRQEEKDGWKVFYRGYWITLLVCLICDPYRIA